MFYHIPKAARTYSPLTLGFVLTALSEPLPRRGCFVFRVAFLFLHFLIPLRNLFDMGIEKNKSDDILRGNLQIWSLNETFVLVVYNNFYGCRSCRR